MVHDYTLHTYVGTLKACNNARRYLAGRNILSEAHMIKHGHYKFTAHFPAKIEEIHARRVMHDAFHGVFIEPFVREVDVMTITDNPVARCPTCGITVFKSSDATDDYCSPGCRSQRMQQTEARARELLESTPGKLKPMRNAARYNDTEGKTHYVGPAIAVNAGLCGNNDPGEATTPYDHIDCPACLAIVRYVLSGGRQE